MPFDQSPFRKPLARGRIAAAVGSFRARAAAEDGVTLIEILVSALLLIIIITGVFRAFDTSAHISGYEQQRSEGQALAQQDEDTIRSLPISQLASLNKTYTKTVGSTTFTILEQAQFQSEATGSSSCSAHGSADVIQTTSTVTWGFAGEAGPPRTITASSIVSTPAGGALIVQVVDSHGNPVSGATVNATGPTDGTPSTSTLTSGSDGCAIFAGLVGGSYNVSAAEANYVTTTGATTATAQETVVEGSSVPAGFQLDKAGQMNPITFTGVGGAAPLVDQMIIANSGMPVPGTRLFGTSGTYLTTPYTMNTGISLFPFASPYTVYAGPCSQDQPSQNGGTDTQVTVPAGGVAAPSLLLPAINVTVYNGSSRTSKGSGISGYKVAFTDTNCSSTDTDPTTTNSSGAVAAGLPYSAYTITATKSLSTTVGTAVATPINNNSTTAQTQVCLYTTAAGSKTSESGAC